MPYLDADGQKIYYEQLGAGPPLVILHGIFIDSAVYRPLAKRLAAYFQVTLIDTPGHGKSGRLSGVYDLESITRSLVKAVEQLGLMRPVLMGHSLGGLWALKIAREVEARQLVLLDPAGAALNIPLRMMIWRMIYKMAANLRVNLLQTTRMLVHAARTILRNLNPRFWRLIKDNLYHDHLRGIAVPACPVILIWGDKDEVIPVELMGRYRECLPQAEPITLQANHDWPIICPEIADWNRLLGMDDPPAAFDERARPA